MILEDRGVGQGHTGPFDEARSLDFILNLRQSVVGFLNRGVTQLNLGLILATMWRTNGLGDRS